MFARRLVSSFLPIAVIGCDGLAHLPPTSGAVDAAPVTPIDWTVRLEATEDLVLPETRWALPTSAGPGLWATTARGRLFVGAEDGLRELADGGSTIRHPSTVTGLVTLPSGDAMLFEDAGIFVLTETLLRPSELTNVLPKTARVLGRRGSAIWFSTPTTLLKLDGPTLVQFSLAGVRALHGPVDGQLVALTTAGVVGLRETATGIEQQRFDDERALASAVPLANGSMLGVGTDGVLARRDPSPDGGYRWHPFALSTDPDAGASVGATVLGVDPESKAAWLMFEGQLRRLDGQRLSSRVVDPFSAFTLEETGALLLRTSTGVVRLGAAASARFSDQVKPISAARCESCHRQNGSAAPVLETAAQWQQHIDRVLARIAPGVSEQLRMPRNDVPLSPDELGRIRRWKEEGYRP